MGSLPYFVPSALRRPHSFQEGLTRQYDSLLLFYLSFTYSFLHCRVRILFRSASSAPMVKLTDKNIKWIIRHTEIQKDETTESISVMYKGYQGIFDYPRKKVKQEFLSQLFIGYFRSLPSDFFCQESRHFIDIDFFAAYEIRIERVNLRFARQ